MTDELTPIPVENGPKEATRHVQEIDDAELAELERAGEAFQASRLDLPASRTASNSQLIGLIEDAVRRDYNRTGPADLPRLLRRRGSHLVYPLLWHDFVDGKPTERHLRCRVLVDTLGGPQEFLLDVAPRNLERLPLERPERKTSGPTPQWQQLLDLQAELIAVLESKLGAASAGSLLHSLSGEGSNEAFSMRLAEGVRRSAAFFVTREMTELVEVAAESVGSWTLDLADLVVNHGFAVFDRPIVFPERTGTDGHALPSRGVAWTLTTIADRAGRTGPGLIVLLCVDMVAEGGTVGHEDAPGVPGLAPLGEYFPAGHRWWPWLVTTWPLGQGVDLPSLSDESWRAPVLALRRVVAALWLLSNQRVALVTSARPPRAERRRAEKLSLPSEVRVVSLRRPAQRHDGDGESRHVEWSHRWLVNGHWRHLWDEARDRERLVWVSPYVKGPDDKPFVPKRTVYRFER